MEKKQNTMQASARFFKKINRYRICLSGQVRLKLTRKSKRLEQTKKAMWTSCKEHTETTDPSIKVRLHKQCALGKPETKKKTRFILKNEAHSGFLNVSSPKTVKSYSRTSYKKESCKPKKPQLNRNSTIENGGVYPKDTPYHDGY
jgi:hypothetical protein